MFKRTIIAATFLGVMAMTTGAAYAEENHQRPVAAAGAVAGASADSQSIAGSNSTAGSAANSQNVNYVNFPQQPANVTQHVLQSGETTNKFAPSFTITGPASGPCTGNSGGFGASWLGGGFGFNAASVDKGCHWRENARTMAMILPVLSAENKAKFEAMIVQQMMNSVEFDPSMMGVNHSK